MYRAYFTTAEPTTGKKLSSIVAKAYGKTYGYTLFGESPWATAQGRVLSARGEIVGTILRVENSKGEPVNGAELAEADRQAR